MGYMRHHAIVVTSFDNSTINSAWITAIGIFGDRVTNLTDRQTNGFQTFCVGPDGSKEGWQESADGDTQRDVFIDWLRAARFDDGSSLLSWVEVQYGDDDHATTSLRSSDDDYLGRLIANGGA